MIMKMPVEGCVQNDVLFGGVLRDIDDTLDPSDRAQLLRLIDKGKRDRTIAWMSGSETRAVLVLSIHNVKLCSATNSEDLLLRILISQVAAVSYIDDHNAHILAITFGELDMQKPEQKHSESLVCLNHIAVLYCESRAQSEEVCSLIDQCLQIVYTDATMHFFDYSLKEGVRQSSRLDSSIYGSDKSMYSRTSGSLPTDSPREIRANHLSQLNSSGSVQEDDDAEASGLMNDCTVRTVTLSKENLRRSSELSDKSSSNLVTSTGVMGGVGLSPNAQKLILNYMNKLYTKLTATELQQFAVLVKAWHTDMTFRDFCSGVSELYGPDRTHLLVEMRPFIPAKDSAYFESFIQDLENQRVHNQHKEQLSDTSLRSCSPVIPVTTSRSRLVMSAQRSNDDEYDAGLSDISFGMERLHGSSTKSTVLSEDQNTLS